MRMKAVVNCFQKFVSLWRRTSQYFEWDMRELLWIAFKNLYLCDGEHQFTVLVKRSIGCELLSKICIFVTANIWNTDNAAACIVVNCFQKFVSLWRRTSRHSCIKTCYLVVNCFQKFVSLWRRTSPSFTIYRSLLLWIAFKNLYLCDGEHL